MRFSGGGGLTKAACCVSVICHRSRQSHTVGLHRNTTDRSDIKGSRKRVRVRHRRITTPTSKFPAPSKKNPYCSCCCCCCCYEVWLKMVFIRFLEYCSLYDTYISTGEYLSGGATSYVSWFVQLLRVPWRQVRVEP